MMIKMMMAAFVVLMVRRVVLWSRRFWCGNNCELDCHLRMFVRPYYENEENERKGDYTIVPQLC